MNKKYFLISLIFIIIFILTSCSQKLIYSKLSMSQINKFIAENNINALDIKDTNDFSIVLFENGQEQGEYTLYKDQNGKLYNSCVKGIFSQNIKETPVSTGGVASGKIPFATVIINDEVILKEAKELEVTFEDGNVIKERINGKGTIILYENQQNTKPISFTKITIYDKDIKKIYEK